MIDSHCHLDLEPLRSDLPNLLQEAADAGVQGFVVPGVHPDGWAGMSVLASGNPLIMSAYGIHPMHAGCVDDGVLDQLCKLSAHGVAIGETGLDPAYQVPMEQQERAFREQIRVALTCNLPLLIHCRKAFQQARDIMREEHADRVGGIMHAFSGSVEMAQEFIRFGFAISISGTVTWRGAVKPLRLAAQLPLEHLVLETDAPDMTPEPYRGTFNRPGWIMATAQRVAEVKGVFVEEVAAVTSDNTRRILRLTSESA